LRSSAGLPREELLRERKFKEMCAMLGRKASLRYKTVRQCFRHLDADHNGTISRSEIVDFFRLFTLSSEFANTFFDMMDVDQSGDISYNELRSIMAPYIQPGYEGHDHFRADKERSNTSKGVDSHMGKEIVSLCTIIGSKAAQRNLTIRDCFRFVDQDRDGVVTRMEAIRFVESFGLPRCTAERASALLAECTGSRDGDIDLIKFVDTLKPFIQPGWKVDHIPCLGHFPRSSPQGPSRRTLSDRTARATRHLMANSCAANFPVHSKPRQRSSRPLDEEKVVSAVRQPPVPMTEIECSSAWQPQQRGSVNVFDTCSVHYAGSDVSTAASNEGGAPEKSKCKHSQKGFPS